MVLLGAFVCSQVAKDKASCRNVCRRRGTVGAGSSGEADGSDGDDDVDMWGEAG